TRRRSAALLRGRRGAGNSTNQGDSAGGYGTSRQGPRRGSRPRGQAAGRRSAEGQERPDQSGRGARRAGSPHRAAQAHPAAAQQAELTASSLNLHNLRNLRSGLLRNLGSGFALLLLRRRSPDQFVRSFDQLGALLILSLLAWAGLDTLHAEAGAELRLDGLYGWSFYLLMGLFGCGLVARAYCREGDTRSLLVPVLSVSPYILIVFWLLTDLSWVDSRPGLELALAVLYLILLGVRVIQAAYTTARTKATVVAVVLIATASVLLRVLDLDTRLWLTDDVEEEQAEDDSTAEALLYDQPARIVSAVQQMAQRQPNTPNAFFLGFAGDGEQSIFKREALFAESV